MYCVIVISEGTTDFKARICRIEKISNTKVDFERNQPKIFHPLHLVLI